MRFERSDLLEQKRLDLISDLERWAKESDILRPGENLVFELRIVNAPVVGEVADEAVARDFDERLPLDEVVPGAAQSV